VNTGEFRRRYEEGERDFAGSSLSGIDISFDDLSNINLEGADLSKAQLVATNLENANFQNADLRGIDVGADCHGNNINFSGANFQGTGLYEGIIEKANFSFADFSGGKIAQYIMTECNFTGANLSDTWISETEFSDCDFTGACFHRAHIEDTFGNANLSNADFSYAVFFYPPSLLLQANQVIIPNAIFTGAIFCFHQAKNAEDLDVSDFHGAICLTAVSDYSTLDFNLYRSSAIESVLEYCARYNNRNAPKL
jgi:uncharacterized protein YjbI with pentapeptide repeats